MTQQAQHTPWRVSNSTHDNAFCVVEESAKDCLIIADRLTLEDAKLFAMARETAAKLAEITKENKELNVKYWSAVNELEKACRAKNEAEKHRNDWKEQSNAFMRDSLRILKQRNELFTAAEILVSQYNESGDFTMGGKLTNKGFLKLRTAIANCKAEG